MSSMLTDHLSKPEADDLDAVAMEAEPCALTSPEEQDFLQMRSGGGEAARWRGGMKVNKQKRGQEWRNKTKWATATQDGEPRKRQRGRTGIQEARTEDKERWSGTKDKGKRRARTGRQKAGIEDRNDGREVRMRGGVQEKAMRQTNAKGEGFDTAVLWLKSSKQRGDTGY
ncbi:hypothetical protein BC826DRAFT_976083 [Russula brevipes]|nr:hypothetical protein BC826DRAFT_976083 [Russula brevipes]